MSFQRGLSLLRLLASSTAESLNGARVGIPSPFSVAPGASKLVSPVQLLWGSDDDFRIKSRPGQRVGRTADVATFTTARGCEADSEQAQRKGTQNGGGRQQTGSDYPGSCGPEPPKAAKQPFERSAHGVKWNDPYRWMENLADAAVVQHLQKENEYTAAMMADTLGLQRQLVKEMRARMPPEESTPPEPWGPWLYYTEIPAGQEYPVYCRRRCQLARDEHTSAQMEAGTESSGSAGGLWSQLVDKWRPFGAGGGKMTGAGKEAKGWGWKSEGDANKEILVDQNELAEQFGYAHVGMCRVSPCQRWLAFTLDTSGQERFSLLLKDLATGRHLEEHLIHGVVSVEWAADGRTFFYTTANELLRPHRIMRRTLDAAAGEEDGLVLESADADSFVDVARTKDWRFLTLNINSKTSSEVYLLDAHRPFGEPRLVEPRSPGLEYFVEHNGGRLYILTNHASPKSANRGSGDAFGEHRLVHAPVESPGRAHWEEVLEAEAGIPLEDMDMFERHAVLYRRRHGLPEVCVLDLPLDPATCPLPPSRLRRVALPQPLCTVVPGSNLGFRAERLRLALSSPTMPEATFDCHLSSGELTLLHQQKVLLGQTPPQAASWQPEASRPPPRWSGSEASSGPRAPPPLRVTPANRATPAGLQDFSQLYSCQHLQARSHDGVPVPLTVMRGRGVPLDGRAPALLIGYGAYGQSLQADWCSRRLSLLDRGWTIALAHTRGGGELGKAWHAAGRLEHKENSFHDLVACAEVLLGEGYAASGRLAGKGTSAGGLLLGAATNLRPDLFRALILQVPFLDVGNTMLDAGLPLTSHEYDEWGDPAKDAAAFRRIRGYSPYDNLVRGASYPAVLATASLQDTRVGCWEAAKWVSLLRDVSAPRWDRPVLLKTSMDTGHFGEGGRYQHLEETALEYAFLLKHVGERTRE